MTWQDAYRKSGLAFGVLPNSEFYGPQGHRGKDYINVRGTVVAAYEAGVVAKVQFSSYIGWCVVVRLSDGLYAGWAHLMNIAVKVGQTVGAGTTLANVAGSYDNPGTSWAGSHIHTTLGPSVDSIFQGTVYDPAPRIADNIEASTAGSGNRTPITEPKRKKPSMYLKFDTEGVGILVTEDGVTGLSGQEFNLFTRLINSDQSTVSPTTDPFLRTEFYIINECLARAKNGPINI